MIYANKLKNIREEHNLKLREIDRILNFEIDTYSQFEREKTILPIKHLNVLCNYFNISIDYVFSFSNTKIYPKYIYEINRKKSGDRLKELRKEHKLTQKHLAEIIKSDNSKISKYEKGINIISTPFLYDICKKFKISADYLLGKIDEPKYLK